jgi:regulator of protease activity HflC (stomatin/prohibitin superfamily)
MLALQLFGGVSALAIAGAARVLLPIVLKPFALKDQFWTLDPEAKGKIAIRGGDFDHAILASDISHLNDPRKRWYDRRFPDWEVLPNTKPSAYYDDRWSIIKAFGGYWVGVPWNVEIYEYSFTWNEPCLNERGEPDYRPRRNQPTKLWFACEFEYIFTFEALTSDNLRVKIQYGLTVQITNPRKALFGIDDWLQRVEVAADRVAKDFIGTHSYALLRGEGEKSVNPEAKENFSAPIKDLTNKLLDEDAAIPYQTGTCGHYGITISAADFRAIELAGAFAAANEEATIKVYNAEQNARSEVIDSEAKATVELNVGMAKAKVIQLTGNATAEAADKRLAAYAKQPELATTMMETDAQAAPGPHAKIIFAGAAERVITKAIDAFAPKTDAH